MNAVIIVAGGSGTRMNSSTPKQFHLLKGIPLLQYSLTAFHRFDESIRLLLALPEHLFDTWRELQKKDGVITPHELIPGGETRFHSVFNCLQHLENEELIAIHDGARPLLSRELIQRLFAAAEKEGNAVPVLPVNESIRMLDGDSNKPVDRSVYRIVQTPQVFQASLILKAYAQPYNTGFTDDATVVESIGETIHLVEGDPVNLKITYPDDILVAEALASTTK